MEFHSFDDIDVTGLNSTFKFSMKCKGIKKLIPYDGFYPVLRTVQLATLLSQSYAEGFVESPPISSQIATQGLGVSQGLVGSLYRYSRDYSPWNTFIAPFIAPGILYNTIKAGIAVDYPVHNHTASHRLHPERADNIAHGGTYSRVLSSLLSDPGVAVHLTGNLMGPLGNPNDFVKNDYRIYTDHRRPRIAENFTLRVPFETLVEPEKLSNIKFVDVSPEPERSYVLGAPAVFKGQGDERYKLAMHNFLAETVDLFTGHLTSFISKDEEEFQPVVAGNAYAMDVSMYASAKNTGGVYYLKNENGFTMYDRDSAFGPACDYSSDTTSSAGQNYGHAPFTPPYYDSISRARIIYHPTTSGVPSLEDIFSAKTSITYYRTGSALSGANSQVTIADDGTATHSIPTINSTSAMQLNSSLNFFGKTKTRKVTFDAQTGAPKEVTDTGATNRWAISTKFETPIMNFDGASITRPLTGSKSAAKGMWHQYGDYSNDSGVYLRLGEIPENEITTRITLGAVDLISSDGTTTGGTGSLLDIVGFDVLKTKRLGKVRERKIWKEAIVAVPFLFEDGEKKFIDIPKVNNEIQIIRDTNLGSTSITGLRFNDNASESVKDMISKMKNYVFPPNMDFTRNPFVRPFAMYIFEFETELSQRDLIDLWQNLPPNIAFKAEEQEVSISHDIGQSELMGNLLLTDKSKDLRWMIFKVKQRAKTNYYKKTIDSSDDAKYQFQFSYGVGESLSEGEVPYSYNWPYDFCSLVELAKIDTELEIKPAIPRANLEQAGGFPGPIPGLGG